MGRVERFSASHLRPVRCRGGEAVGHLAADPAGHGLRFEGGVERLVEDGEGGFNDGFAAAEQEKVVLGEKGFRG